MVWPTAAFLYYSSIYCNWWDFGGMSSVYIEIGGIHPTSCRPNPQPTTPHNSVVMIKLLSQKEKNRKIHGHFCTIAPYFVSGGIWVGWLLTSTYTKIGGIHPTSNLSQPTTLRISLLLQVRQNFKKINCVDYAFLSLLWIYFANLVHP